MNTHSSWITTQEAADRLGVSTARIRQMMAEGLLSGQKMGGKYRGQWQIDENEVALLAHKKGVNHTMRVKSRMTPSPITASTKTNYNQALRLMKDNGIKNLPVLDGKGQLVGIVTYTDMLKAEPSQVTTLSVFEMVEKLDKVTMEHIMSKPVLAVDENCSITNAANFMIENDVKCLPVVKDNQLTGIITDTDIFKTFVEITGGGKPGTHIEAQMPDQPGKLAPFIQAITKAGSYIVSVVLSYSEEGFGHVDVKERGGDTEKIKTALDELGYLEDINFRASVKDQIIKFG